jgi:hypothetical protein
MDERYSIRIKSYPGESLLSYILRFVNDNGINFLLFWNSLKWSNSHYAQFSDMSMLNFAPVNVINLVKLAEVTSNDIKDINQMTLINAVNKLCGDSEVQHSRFVSNLIREDFYYCSSCFAENKYHKLLWCVSGIDICDLHHSGLYNKCTTCGKVLKLKDVVNIGYCPYCNCELKIQHDTNDEIKLNLQWQLWLYDAYKTLIMQNEIRIRPSDTAMKMIYILNNLEDYYNRDIIQNSLKNKNKCLSLLQCARGTILYNRTLHLSFILSTLYKNKISMNRFLEMQVPISFIDSVLSKTISKKSDVYCLAPWCKNYEKKGLLLKTGTTLRKKIDGTVLKYYLRCPECGCEYAFDDDDDLVERTYFIKNYFLLEKLSKQEFGLKKLSIITEQSEETIRRCLAYFNSRGLFAGECNRIVYNDETILSKFINAIKSDVKINTIKKWPIWDSYNQFLYYRFHKDVMKTINCRSDYKAKGKKLDISQKQNLIKKLVKQMYEEDIDITIENVCMEIGICHETVRNWSCNNIISDMKKKQKNKRLNEFKDSLMDKINNFIKEGNDKNRKELYDYLGVSRKTLWSNGISISSLLIDSK